MKRMPALAVGIVGVSLALSACGSSTSSSSGSGGSVEGKIGVILPDTKSSVRWENADKPALSKAFETAGVQYDIQNAQGDASKMQTIADQMITQGVTVLAIVNLDSESGAAIEKKAASQGVATIDYDRLTLGGSAKYYVSFDNTKVGQLQGEGLAKCLGNKTANIAYLNGSPTDNNATLFSNGAHSVLDKQTEYKKVAEQAVPDWDNQKAATIFEQMYTQNPDINGVYAANDGLGQAVISILAKNNAAGKVPVTGQDATVQGLQNILDGTQCMTVYKSANEEAGALAKLAIGLAKGEQGQTTGTVKDSESGREVPSVLLDPVSIMKDNISDVVDDGGVTTADLCAGSYAQKCKDAGIS
ncbi:MAG: sugar ABC transporter substrate-binding protein [Mycobacteriales bacterium]